MALDDNITLLTLLPGADADDIRVHLHAVRLRDAGPYNTLPYVWGDTFYSL